MAPTCSVTDCQKPARAVGMCVMHYTRVLRRGTTDALYPQGDPLDRLMAKVEKAGHGGCWIFIGNTTKNGYALVGEGKAGWHYGHRLAYSRLVGPIPDGHRLHHECETPLCVNPAHLTPTTAKSHAVEHGLGVGPCAKCGGDDWYIRPDTGTRQCRGCRRARRSPRSAC